MMDVVEVTHRGVEVLKCPEVMKLVRRDLMVRPFNPQQAFPQAFPVFAETPSKVIVPLHWARSTSSHLQWVDKRVAPTPVNLEFVGALKPELRQVEAVEAVQAAWRTTGGAMLCLPTGYGKCLAPETPVLTYDGAIIPANDLEIGMRLMGMDGTPRNVLGVGRGREMMYEIRPIKGDPWRCNETHILSLRYSGHGSVKPYGTSGGAVSFCETRDGHAVFASRAFQSYELAAQFAASLPRDPVVDISVRDYLGLPTSVQAKLKLFRASRLTFAPRAQPLFDPYVIGAWLGDGTASGPVFTLTDDEIVDEIEKRCRERGMGLVLVKHTARAPNYRLRSLDAKKIGKVNEFLDVLRAYNLLENKHIPEDIKCGSVETRLAVLAGLLDTDGHLFGNCFEITQKRGCLAHDIVFVARSLGYAANIKPSTKSCVKPDGSRVSGQYYRVTIYGEGLQDIPTVLPRKQAAPRQQKKNALITGFKCVPVGVGDYVGPMLDGDHRYLLGDYTVTHNTTVSLYLACSARCKTLVLVHKEFLATQWEERIRQFVPGATITKVQGEQCDTSGDFVVAMIQTLVSRKYPPSTFASCGLVVADECFPYRQRILTEHGPMEIGIIYKAWKKGQVVRVHSFDEVTMTFKLQKVTHAWEKSAGDLVKVSYSKSNFKSTPNHLILTTSGWKRAGAIQPGDLLVSRYSGELTEEAVARAMNPDQYQVFLGSLLGDGHLDHIPSGRYRLSVTHGMKQREYCQWKAGMFGAQLQQFVGGYKNDIEVRFATRVIDLPVDKIYPQNKTYCPQWVLDDLDERGLAIWHMDDGSLAPCGSIRLSTHSFDEDSHVRMCAKLKSMGLGARYTTVRKRNGAEYFNIVLQEEAGRKMVSMIAKYIHPSMRYKVANTRVERCNVERFNFTQEDNFSDFFAVPDLRDLGTRWTVRGVLYEWKYCLSCLRRDFHPVKRVNLDGSVATTCLIRTKPSAFPDISSACSYTWNSAFMDYGTLRVSNVQSVTPGDKRVYDLEVEGTHTFVCTSACGSGPVVHNCHHVAAQGFSSAMWGLCAPLTLGLTATPARKDRLERVVNWFMGDIAFQVKRENQEGTVVKVRTYSTARYREPPPVNKRGDVCFTSIITELANDTARTEVVADEAATLAKERDVLVLSHRRGHCTAIAAALVAKGVNVATYLGGDKSVPDTRVIVATYALTSEGFDCPRLSALVLATPASDVEQSCGRVMRGSSSQSAVIVDVVDDWGVCYAQHAKRKAFYKRCGFKVGSGGGKAHQPSPPRQKEAWQFVEDK